ncbi:hypothetical protein V6Z88_005192 [Aspergillus fumigatus]
MPQAGNWPHLTSHVTPSAIQDNQPAAQPLLFPFPLDSSVKQHVLGWLPYCAYIPLEIELFVVVLPTTVQLQQTTSPILSQQESSTSFEIPLQPTPIFSSTTQYAISHDGCHCGLILSPV